MATSDMTIFHFIGNKFSNDIIYSKYMWTYICSNKLDTCFDNFK